MGVGTGRGAWEGASGGELACTRGAPITSTATSLSPSAPPGQARAEDGRGLHRHHQLLRALQQVAAPHGSIAAGARSTPRSLRGR